MSVFDCMDHEVLAEIEAWQPFFGEVDHVRLEGGPVTRGHHGLDRRSAQTTATVCLAAIAK